jgi:hypothetical protein
MDYLLILYSLLMGMVLIFPFVYLGILKNNPQKEIPSPKNSIERKMLLENLRDLKTDYETKKFSESDFAVLSEDIIRKLEEIDKKIEKEPIIEEIKNKCMCGEKNHIPNAKFCHFCGKKLSLHS